MTPQALQKLSPSLGVLIEREFRLGGNDPLLASCAQRVGEMTVDPPKGASIIIVALWERLQDEHLLRVVK